MASYAYAGDFSRARPPSQVALQVETWLKRYPELSDAELAKLIATFPNLPMLDYALMTADKRLAGKLAAFHGDHGSKLKSPWSSLAAFAAISVIAATALWWVTTPAL